MPKVDDQFFPRADAHINLANDQMEDGASRGNVSASNMYAAARFNAWVSACGWSHGDAMRKAKQETIDYYLGEYRRMLETNLDDYIANFETLMGRGQG